MQQKSGDNWRPLGFFSQKFSEMESPYSTLDQELLAAYASIRHFRHFCEGHPFQLWTDHNPLLVTALPHVTTSSNILLSFLYSMCRRCICLA